jgi:hypothetical protein
MYLHPENYSKETKRMQGGIEPQIEKELKIEIAALQTHYQTIQIYLQGTEIDNLQIAGALQAFKNGLSRISTHVLALYQLRGQKTKITWQPLLDNIEEALETMQRHPKAQPRTTIQTALGMSEPTIQEVMAYLGKLEKSLS